MSEQKRLLRTTSDRVIGGVAGGLARYFQIDPTFVRVAFVMLAFFNGLGLLIYLLMWLAVPAENAPELTGEAAVRANIDDMGAQIRRVTGNLRGGSSGSLLGIILVALGVIFLANQLIPSIPSGIVFPAVLIAVGVYVLFARR